MELMKKSTIKKLIELGENKKAKIDLLKKRHNYLASKSYKNRESNEIKYINYHLKKMGARI
jgi:hypothetical protein